MGIYNTTPSHLSDYRDGAAGRSIGFLLTTFHLNSLSAPHKLATNNIFFGLVYIGFSKESDWRSPLTVTFQASLSLYRRDSVPPVITMRCHAKLPKGSFVGEKRVS